MCLFADEDCKHKLISLWALAGPSHALPTRHLKWDRVPLIVANVAAVEDDWSLAIRSQSCPLACRHHLWCASTVAPAPAVCKWTCLTHLAKFLVVDPATHRNQALGLGLTAIRKGLKSTYHCRRRGRRKIGHKHAIGRRGVTLCSLP